MVNAELDRCRQWILSLTDNWDDENTKAFDPDFVNRVMDCLQIIVKINPAIPVPCINVTQTDEIEIHWNLPNFRITLMAPDDPAQYMIYMYQDQSSHRESAALSYDEIIHHVVAKFA